jgi:hypothetical protein
MFQGNNEDDVVVSKVVYSHVCLVLPEINSFPPSSERDSMDEKSNPPPPEE